MPVDSYTVADLLRKPRCAYRVNPDRVAVRFGSRQLTYDELDERSDRLASALRAHGFVKGDRVGVLLYNRLEWVETFFALAKLGGVVVPINYLLKPQEVSYIADDAGLGWLIYEQELSALVGETRKIHSGIRGYVGVETVDAPADVLDYEVLIASGEHHPDALPPAEVRADDLLVLQYTSGTTGQPKGAMHTHSTVQWNSFHQIVDYGVTADEVYLVVPALCWAAGLHYIALATLWRGGRVVLNPSTGFDPAEFLATVQRERITSVLLVPTVLKRVLAEPTFDTHDLSSLRLICSGGEPVPVTALEEMRNRLPACDLVQSFGMSEFPCVMAYLEPRYAAAKLGSTGRSSSAAELRVVDENGHEAPPGEAGEIICRSPASMIGYYRRPEATAATLVDGWLHTGDLGYVDDEGFIYVAGRAKDVLISGGLNVYPAEVERVIAQHPAVHEAAVIGVPDDQWGEIGHAVVVLHPSGQLTETELRDYLGTELAKYKIPKRWTLRQEPLPRTTSGKVQKFVVREQLGLSQTPALVGKPAPNPGSATMA
jgi:fatty-acyl-CoA synthase